MVLESCKLPDTVKQDMNEFVNRLYITDADLKNLGITGVHEEDIINILKDTFGL